MKRYEAYRWERQEEAVLAQSYFKDFWIITNKGEKPFPALIRNRKSGRASYRILADGSNKIGDGREVFSPIEAIGMFLNYHSMRFGREGGGPDNRFNRGSNFVVEIGAAIAFREANPRLRW